MKFTAVSLLYFIATIPAFAQNADRLTPKFDEAERRIVRLSPAAFPDLPGNVARELERRGCMIPQTAYTRKPHNVIKGQFAKSGQTDWAVLCSVKGISTILVFWNGAGSNPAAIAPMEDRNFLQSSDTTDPVFSRAIRTVGKQFIMRHYEAHGGPKPPVIDHQGIDDEFVEKGSSVWYFHAGKWLQLTGAD